MPLMQPDQVHNQIDFYGIGNRGLAGGIFDFADTLLNYQGIPSAAGWHYMIASHFTNYDGWTLMGHSDGAMTVNNISFWGQAKGPTQVYGLPFGNGGAYGTSVNNHPGDPVVGLIFGWLINPTATAVPGEGHAACHYNIPNWHEINQPGC
ncbi:MAG: hypothetical protein ACM3ZT_09745 [Bacillota bacterium]